MAKKYYTDNSQYPKLVLEIIRRLKIYLAELLYGEEYVLDPNNALNRIIISDVDAGADIMVGDSVKKFQLTNAEFPFTAYNIGEFSERKEQNSLAVSSGFVYCEDVEARIRSWPMQFEIPLFSFFAKASDYMRARSILHGINQIPIKLEVPIIINSNTVYFTISMIHEISRGSYAHAFEEYLRINDIWDIQHGVIINYYDIIFDDGSSSGTGSGGSGGIGDGSVYPPDKQGIYPVDDMILELWERDENNQPLTVDGPLTITSVPQVSSVSPVNEATGVAVDSNIEITFSLAMNPDSVYSAVSISPFVSGDWSVDTTDKIFIFNPINNLDAATTYTVEILKTVSDGVGGNLREDYTWSFTTV